MTLPRFRLPRDTKRFEVRCLRWDGRERAFSRHDDRAAAEKTVATLKAQRMMARVVDLDEERSG